MKQKLGLILGALCPRSIQFLEFPQMRKGIFVYVSFLVSSQKDNQRDREVSFLKEVSLPGLCLTFALECERWSGLGMSAQNHKLCCWLLQSLLISHLTRFWSFIQYQCIFKIIPRWEWRWIGLCVCMYCNNTSFQSSRNVTDINFTFSLITLPSPKLSILLFELFFFLYPVTIITLQIKKQ